MRNLDENVPSLGPDFDSVVEVNMTETMELMESSDALHSKSESVASVDAEDEGTGADKMENTGSFGRRVELETSSIPSFRTVPAMSKVELFIVDNDWQVWIFYFYRRVLDVCL